MNQAHLSKKVHLFYNSINKKAVRLQIQTIPKPTHRGDKSTTNPSINPINIQMDRRHLSGIFPLKIEDGESKSLGCRFLFRESVNAGYRFNKRHALMLHFDHSSNANLCEKNTRDGTAEGRHDVTLNEGLESVGVRYGYMF